MVTTRTMLLAGSIIIAHMAQGQNTPPVSTPQTKAAAPAATRTPATRTQAAGTLASTNPAAPGSRRSARSKGQAGFPPNSASNTSAAGAQPSAPASGTDYDGSSGTREVESSGLPGIPMPHNAYGIAKGTPIHVRLQQSLDSAHARNGQMVRGVLAAPVGSVPAGAPVQLTVVAVAPAGQLTSNGELSLQVVSVNGEQVLSDVITAEGKEGAKVLPDDAPGRGTEAVFTPDQPLILPAG